jgi:hypothetical protein
MKHISKFDGKVYEVSKSVSMIDGKQYDDDITLIWYDKPYDEDVCHEEDDDARVLVSWYWGDYNYDMTEIDIEYYWTEVRK